MLSSLLSQTVINSFFHWLWSPQVDRNVACLALMHRIWGLQRSRNHTQEGSHFRCCCIKHSGLAQYLARVLLIDWSLTWLVWLLLWLLLHHFKHWRFLGLIPVLLPQCSLWRNFLTLSFEGCKIQQSMLQCKRAILNLCSKTLSCLAQQGQMREWTLIERSLRALWWSMTLKGNWT